MRLDAFTAYFEKNHSVTVDTCRLLPSDRWNWQPTDEIFTARELVRHIAYSQRWFAEAVVAADFEWKPEDATRSLDSLGGDSSFSPKATSQPSNGTGR